jgi:hypothetical protein
MYILCLHPIYRSATRVLSGPSYHVTPGQASLVEHSRSFWKLPEGDGMSQGEGQRRAAIASAMRRLHQPGLCPYPQGPSGLAMALPTYPQGI